MECIVDGLKAGGFASNEISALLPDKSGTQDFAHEQSTKLPEGATTGGLAGMGVGAALGGAAVGGAAGGVIGALVGMGIPEYEAKLYEGKIRGGSGLISVHTDSSDQVKAAKEVYKRFGAEDIKSTSEASVPS